MRKIILSVSIVVLLVLLVGCLNYKATPKGDTSADDAALIDQIASVEEGVNASQRSGSANVTAEGKSGEVQKQVIVPNLGEKPKEVASDSDYTIIKVKENQTVRLRANIVDPDGDNVTYSFSKPLSKSGEWKTNYGDAGEYIVSVIANDGKLTSEQKLKIVVERVNVAPVIEGIKDITVDEGKMVTFTPVVGDPNKDPVTIKISDPLSTGKWATDHKSAGQYKITVSASDGELATDKLFTLTVNDINVLPEIKGAQDVITVKEGEAVTIKPQIVDQDDDQVALSISAPVGDTGVWQTGYTDHGEYTVTITANDGKDKVVKKVTVVVEDVNVPPQIVDVTLEQ